MTITILDHSTVHLVNALASDAMVCQAARVSTQGDNSAEAKTGLINYLVKNRHGSPFEHTFFEFYAHAPIFVFREWHRHRIASINEMSARYMELLPEFYSPPRERPLIQKGSSAHPDLQHADNADDLWEYKRTVDTQVFENCWGAYQNQISAGIALEIARSVLPVATMSKMYFSINARSLMNFLSLRVKDENATFPSNPQWEINRCADMMEEAFELTMPFTYDAFVANGRVSP